MASSITALKVLLPVCLWVGPAEEPALDESGGRLALTDDDLAEWFAAKGCLGIASGEIGDCPIIVLGVDTTGVVTTSFSSTKNGMLSLELVVVLVFRAASLARFANVGTLVAELTFLTSMGRAVTFLATIELLLLPILGTCGICGVLELGVDPLPGVVEPDLTLTTLACARKACCAGTGGTIASRP